MAELDPEKVGRSGIDPGTGSPLSPEVRSTLLRKSIIDQSVFKNQLLESENKKREIDNQNVKVIQSQEQALLGFNSNIQALRSDIGKLGTGLASISLLLQQDSADEISRTRAEQEKERRLAEQQVRIGKENELEQKIQNALVTPVQKLTPKMNDVFGRIGRALGILFGGWLTNQVVQAIQASEEGNTTLFNNIKFNIVKNLAIVGGGLLAISAGFSLIKRTIGKIAFGLTRLLIVTPLVAASNLLRGRGINPGGGKPRGGKPGGGGIGVGRFIIFLSGLMNLKNKEFADTTLATMAGFLSRGPGALGLIGKLAGIMFTADEIAEALGKNIFDDSDLNKKVDQIAQYFNKKESNKNAPPPASPKPAPSSTPSSAAPTPPPAAPTPPPVAQPQTTMMGQSKTDGVEANSNSGASIQSSSQSSETSSTSPPAQVESSPQSSMASMSFSMGSFGVDKTGLTGPESPLVTAPAQVAPPEKPSTQVGQLPEAQPSVTMIKTSNNANQQANVPLTSGALSDVPLINSANPDNFYVLYSQLNYNVVM